MRLFVAADLPEAILQALRDNLEGLEEAKVEGRLVSPESFHVTLAFLGEVEGSRIPGIKAALMYAVENMAAFNVTLDDYGMFPKPYDSADGAPRTLWQGFDDDELLTLLAESVRRELGGLGISYEGEFKPHVTLARKVTCSLNDLPDPWVDGGLIRSITLYRSRLSNTGATYEPLHTARLQEPYRHPKGPLVIVDADACPVVRETLVAARQTKTPVLLVANGTQNLSRHLRRSDPRTPRKGYWVATMNVIGGSDSADYQIATLVQAGDVVITQDIGVAAMALGADARAIGVRGREYKKEAIDALLLVRHEEKKVRRQGGRTAGPAPFTDEDKQRFAACLAAVLSQG